MRYNARMSNSKTISKLLNLGMVFFFASCSPEASWQKRTTLAMDTTINLRAKLTGDQTSELDDVLSTFTHYHRLSDTAYSHTNVVDVKDINEANGPIEISKDLYELLSFSLEMKEATSGYFNPLAGDLANLWKGFAAEVRLYQEGGLEEEPSFPSEAAISSCLNAMNNTTLVLNVDDGKYTAELTTNDANRGKASIDLGGIAKGYAAEKAKQLIHEKGWDVYALDAGSSTIVLGKNETEGGYSLSWRDDLPGYKIEHLQDVSISTSSVTVQGVKWQGKMYSHLVNPKTGEASPSITGVTIFGKKEETDAGMMDAFTTALMWASDSERNAWEEKQGFTAIYYLDGKLVENHGVSLTEIS